MKDKDSSEPIRELEWLAHFFTKYGRDDVAKEILDKITRLRNETQKTLNVSEEATRADVSDAFKRNEDISSKKAG